jgi:signal transduction histidine kinase
VVGLTTLLVVAMSVWLAYVLRRRLMNVVGAREEVLAVVSHDLRNPLAAISLACRAGGRKTDPVTAGYFARIQDAAQRMEQIIEELLDTARAQQGLLELNRQRVDLTPLVAGTVKLFEEQLAEKRVQLDVQLPEHVDVHADARRIARVLINLLSNALKFTPEGGRISVRAEDAGPFEKVSVRDTGPGMSPEQLPNLFQKHWQAHRAEGGGLGLGLYIVRVLVEAHGGSVQVESRPGEGSTFSFTVPRA